MAISINPSPILFESLKLVFLFLYFYYYSYHNNKYIILQKGKCIGRGNFGIVYKGEWRGI